MQFNVFTLLYSVKKSEIWKGIKLENTEYKIVITVCYNLITLQ